MLVETTAPIIYPLRILTHNIRYATTDLFPNERPWEDRCPLIARQLRHATRFLPAVANDTDPSRPHNGTAIICLQEVLHRQLVDILSSLNGPDDVLTWDHIGVGRGDGKQAGEYSPILYCPQVVRLLHTRTRWLSPTPNVPSKGWDAGSTRIVTVGVFEDRASGARFVVGNTHLDNAGPVSREKGVKVALETVRLVGEAWGVEAMVLAGDFNSDVDGEAYQAILKSGEMAELSTFVDEVDRYGEEVTFTDFDPEKDGERLDFIWLGPRSSLLTAAESSRNSTTWKVLGYSVLPNRFEDGVYCSDHRCVVGDVQLTQYRVLKTTTMHRS